LFPPRRDGCHQVILSRLPGSGRFVESAVAMVLRAEAGLSKFIPYIGPFVAVVPAALLALPPPHGFGTVLWVVGVYLGIEMIDDHVILPLLNWRTIWLPPALAIFAQVVLATLSVSWYCGNTPVLPGNFMKYQALLPFATKP
jgi:hypothetical protein